MKFLPLRELDSINRALVFDTPDCRVVGGVDIYTTKAAGADKKLYKSICETISNRYEADLRLSESLSPPNHGSDSASKYQSAAVYQTLHSPFGPLDQISARRTFAYLIAVLNASHPDYDFSTTLRPSDFRRECNIRPVMNNFNTTLFNLGVNISRELPKMWETIDKEMDLLNCDTYAYSPDDVSNDPYGDEGLIWSTNLFFFNKHKKRVCYLYLRGLSTLNHSPFERSLVGWGGNGRLGSDGWDESEGEDFNDDFIESKSIWGDDNYDDGFFEGMEV
ncbi:repressor of RNA polymerase III transcription MAF1 [Choiromyces venosus 120613-1]|uniref:Repressor of RNA polymerase III transcription MAF1 n=1 Tax=Choiromyces venosus 120613-1 TaxID=1336337 RepID=A0A3N4IYP9_9PEZI|nr:repressor of RNA polymerase III transcription MAF1 [Choiromyces venosus 120613-1]